MLNKLKALIKKLVNGGGKSGFTLIEIVIVLAIAGLIFVIVFFAVSQAQAARRDTERKSAASRMLAAGSQYSSNNQGSVPCDGWLGGDACSGAASFFDVGNGDPATGTWTFSDAATDAAGEIYFNAGSTCSGNAFAVGTARQFAVKVYQEKGTAYCIDSE